MASYRESIVVTPLHSSENRCRIGFIHLTSSTCCSSRDNFSAWRNGTLRVCYRPSTHSFSSLTVGMLTLSLFRPLSCCQTDWSFGQRGWICRQASWSPCHALLTVLLAGVATGPEPRISRSPLRRLSRTK